MNAPVLAGVDGCPAGWLCITRDLRTKAVRSAIHPDAASLFAQVPVPAILCIDIPIGLADRGPRQADLEARRVLAPDRHTSVFASPTRPILAAADYAAAAAVSRELEGKSISKQAFNIYHKIREVDAAMRASPALRHRVREVHPEVCFWAWNGGSPMPHAKKTPQGHADRRSLIAEHFGDRAFDQVRAAHPRRADATGDDIADAFAALWTAERLHAGDGATLPGRAPLDAFGLRMEMCY